MRALQRDFVIEKQKPTFQGMRQMIPALLPFLGNPIRNQGTRAIIVRLPLSPSVVFQVFFNVALLLRGKGCNDVLTVDDLGEKSFDIVDHSSM